METPLTHAALKSELARAYFPQDPPKRAVQKMLRWIRRAPELIRQLRAMGYRPQNKYYTKREIDCLLRWFGDP